jgi:hypothetical protein
MASTKIKVTGVVYTVNQLKELDKKIINQARKDLRTGAQPVARAVKANIPNESPLQGKGNSRTRGMIHNGRTAWKPSGVKVTIRTNFSKKAERKGFSLVSIVAGSRGKFAQGSAAFQIADIAGRKARGKTASGRAMINKLNSKGRASRYVYPAALREIPYIINEVKGTIKGLSKSLNNELKKGR